MNLNYITRSHFIFNDFLRIPRLLFDSPMFSELSNDAKLLYTVLLDRASLSADNGWVDRRGYVYIHYGIIHIQRTLGCSKSKALRLLDSLESVGLIERKRQGQGKPNMIYVRLIADA